MMNRFLYTLLVALCLLAACNRDPNVAKQRYLENGNKYFEKGKYKEALIMYRNALKRDLKFGEAYYRAALAGLKLQRYAEAVRDLERAVELQPQNMDALDRLANLYLNVYMVEQKRAKHLLNELTTLNEKYKKRFPGTYGQVRLQGYLYAFANDVPNALASFEKANHLKPHQQDLVLVYMQTLAAAKRVDEALKVANDMLAADPSAMPVWDALIVYHARQKNWAEVENLINQKVQKNPKSAEARLQLAAHHHQQQNQAGVTKALQGLLSDRTTFPRGPMMVGDFFLRTRNYDQAAQNYRQGLQAEPKDKNLYNKRLVEVLTRQDKKQDAVALLNEVLKDDPKDDDAIAMRASLSLLAGTKDQLQSAINDLQTVLSRQPRNFVVRYNLGRALLAQQNPSAARVQFEEAVKLRSDYLPARVALGQLTLQQREFGKANQMAQEILALDANHAGAHLLRSRALLGMGQVKQARAELTQTAEQFPQLSEARLHIAGLDLQERNFKAAEDGFRKLLAERRDPRAFLGLMDSYIGQGQVDTAKKLLKEEIARHPERMEYRFAMAALNTRTNDLNGAMLDYKSILAADPKNATAWLRISDLHRRTGDLGASIEAGRKAQELAPNTVSPHLQLALLYEGAGKRIEARPMYEQVLKLQPSNVIALNNLAYILAENGTDLDQALTMAQQARQMFPNDLNIADTLGWIYIKKNLPDSAISILRDIIQKQPQRATYHYHLAMALFQKGDRASAKKSCEVALSQKPSKAEEDQIRELMSKIG